MHSIRQNFYSFQVKSHDGSFKSLADYKGQVVLVVNVASRCVLLRNIKGLKNYMNTLKIVVFPY